MSDPESTQKILLKEGELVQAAQKNLQKAIYASQQLDSQLNENKMVIDELLKLKGDANVYKLIGKALVKQDVDDARQTVTKRIDYITQEIKKQEAVIKDLSAEVDKHRETMRSAQQNLQKSAVQTTS